MSSRGATMVVAGVLLALLISVAALRPVPYVALSPGPTYNTLGAENGRPLIEITGRESYPADGNLNLTTVEVTGAGDRLGLFEAFLGWLDPEVAVVPKETLYPDDRTPEEIEQKNAEDMELSQEHAVAAALLELGVEPTSRTTLVAAVEAGAPASGKLHAGDVITAIDGAEVTSPDDVQAAIRAHPPGEEVEITVRRGGETEEITVGTRAAPDDPSAAQVGIAVESGYAWPFDVTIQLDDVGGPSAGLMFALGIYDKLTPGDLTGGKFIAGTGTIDDLGNVGPIGGIQMKIIKADEEDASAFLAPAANCDEATRDAPSGIMIVRVQTLDDALAAVRSVAAGETESLTTC